jgi:hypothetical protein
VERSVFDVTPKEREAQEALVSEMSEIMERLEASGELYAWEYEL